MLPSRETIVSNYHDLWPEDKSGPDDDQVCLPCSEVDDNDIDSDLCSLLSYKSFLNGESYATAAPPPTPAASQTSTPWRPTVSRKQPTVRTPRTSIVMKNTVITVNVTGPGKLAMTTPHQQQVRKTRPKAAYLHGPPPQSFTTGLEQTSNDELQELFPPPIGFQSLPSVQSLTESINKPAIDDSGSRNKHADKERTERTQPKGTTSPTSDRLYYRFYCGADMTDKERAELGYKARATPTITASVGGMKGKTPNRWGSACSMRSMDYHLAELSLYYRGANIAAPTKLKSLKTKHQQSQRSEQHQRPITASHDVRQPANQRHQRIFSAQPRSISSQSEADNDELTVPQRQFQKRNQLLREQMDVYIQWKTAEQIKEREGLAKRTLGRNGRQSILKSGKEKRLQMFNTLLRQQEAEYASEVREHEEFVDDYEEVKEEEWMNEGDNKLTEMWQMLQ